MDFGVGVGVGEGVGLGVGDAVGLDEGEAEGARVGITPATGAFAVDVPVAFFSKVDRHPEIGRVKVKPKVIKARRLIFEGVVFK